MVDVAGMETLPSPVMSKNLIYEDRHKVRQVMSYILNQNQDSGALTYQFDLKRGECLVLTEHLTESLSLLSLVWSLGCCTQGLASEVVAALCVGNMTVSFPLPPKRKNTQT